MSPWGAAGAGRAHQEPGWAVQVDPIKPTLKAPGTYRLILEYDQLFSKFAFNCNLRRYNLVDKRRLLEIDEQRRKAEVERCMLIP